MAGLNTAAAGLKALLGSGVMLKRDKARGALFVSDYARRRTPLEAGLLEARLLEGGWKIAIRGSLRLLDWPFEGYRAFFENLPPGQPSPEALGLARILNRHPAGFDAGMLKEAREALMLFDAGETGRLLALAGGALAVCLREKRPLPAFYARLLLAARD